MVRPLLFVDIDGVLNPYGADDYPEGYDEHRLFPAEEEPVRLCVQHGVWLHELAETFDMVWGSSWSEEDRLALAGVLDLPLFHDAVELPHNRRFDPQEKIPAIASIAGNRPLAWIDDLLTPDARAWANARPVPTFLVDIDPSTGLTREVVDDLIRWASSIS